MVTGNERPVRSSFETFLRGDWARLSEVMDADVQWLRCESGDWDCHDRGKVLATLFERRHEGVVMTARDAVIAVDERAQARPEQAASATLWCAAHGGQRENAQLLLDNGADTNWVGHDRLIAAAAAERSGARARRLAARTVSQ